MLQSYKNLNGFTVLQGYKTFNDLTTLRSNVMISNGYRVME